MWRQGCPDLIHLMEEGEEKEEFFKLPVEEVLLRWFNHHLRQGSHLTRILRACFFRERIPPSVMQA